MSLIIPGGSAGFSKQALPQTKFGSVQLWLVRAHTGTFFPFTIITYFFSMPGSDDTIRVLTTVQGPGCFQEGLDSGKGPISATCSRHGGELQTFLKN